jgi:hypothetical protein
VQVGRREQGACSRSERRWSVDTLLDRVCNDDVTAEPQVGYLVDPRRLVPETDQYLGSTIVVLCAPIGLA